MKTFNDLITDDVFRCKEYPNSIFKLLYTMQTNIEAVIPNKYLFYVKDIFTQFETILYLTKEELNNEVEIAQL